MNFGSSNAKVITALTETDTALLQKEDITCTNYTHSRNAFKQRICGAILIAAAVFAVIFAEDMELVLALIPVGIWLIFSKKSILTFNED